MSNFSGCAHWETSGADLYSGRAFIQALRQGGYLPKTMRDPSNLLDHTTCGNYMYYRYPAGSYGCTKPFYVLGIMRMTATGGNKYPNSPGFSCPDRDFQDDMSWVTGAFE
jgi:hypothetical protein